MMNMVHTDQTSPANIYPYHLNTRLMGLAIFTSFRGFQTLTHPCCQNPGENPSALVYLQVCRKVELRKVKGTKMKENLRELSELLINTNGLVSSEQFFPRNVPFRGDRWFA